MDFFLKKLFYRGILLYELDILMIENKWFGTEIKFLNSVR